jgi:hypothetical protein
VVITIKIGTVAVPAHSRFDAADLGARVSAEIADLLARKPLSGQPRCSTTVALPGGAIPVATAASPAAAAHAIAGVVVAGLVRQEGVS